MHAEVLAKFNSTGARNTLLWVLGLLAAVAFVAVIAVLHPERFTITTFVFIAALTALFRPWIFPMALGAVQILKGSRAALWVQGDKLICASPLIGFSVDLDQIQSVERYDWRMKRHRGVNLKLHLRSGAIKQIPCAYVETDPDVLVAILKARLFRVT